jgi:hypothetical protein
MAMNTNFTSQATYRILVDVMLLNLALIRYSAPDLDAELGNTRVMFGLCGHYWQDQPESISEILRQHEMDDYNWQGQQ